MSITEKELQKEQLIKLINGNLNWSESSIRSFSKDTLDLIYDRLLRREYVGKAKISSKLNHETRFYIPVEIRNKYGIGYGSRFNIKLNPFKKELYLDFVSNGKYKVGTKGMLRLPYQLFEKRIIKEKDDTLLLFDDNRLTIKSFTFLQN